MIYNRIPRNHFPPVVTLWTPAELTTDLWLDADDYSTLTIVSDKSSAWTDKSGHSRHASQSVVAYRPIYSATGFNGRPTLVFDGTDDQFNLVVFVQAFGQNAWAVADTTNIGTGWRMLLSRDSGGGPAFYFGCPDNDAKPAVYWGADLSIQSTAVQRKAIFRWAIDEGPLVYTQVDGGSEASEASETSTVAYWNKISNLAGGQSANMLLSEIVMTPSALSESDRQKLEGYLAHKWGISANLPVGHPYKNSAPVV